MRTPLPNEPADPTPDHDQRLGERFDDELFMHLEPDQFVAETSQPVSRAQLGARVTAGLWGLRIFVVLVSLMVIYTFITQVR